MNICLISNLKDNTNDERIFIRPNLVKVVDGDASMEYNVIHRIPSSMLKNSTSQVVRMTLRSMTDLMTYVESILELLRADESPYASVQFDIPMMPSVLVSPQNICYSVRESIAKHLSLLQNAWPVVPLPLSRRESVASCSNFSSSNPCCEAKSPSGSNPSGSNPSGSNPSGSNPSGSNPSGSKVNKHIFFNDEPYHPGYCL